jgi:hypothetical protein
MPQRRLSAIREAVSLLEAEIDHIDIPPDLEERVVALGARMRSKTREVLSPKKSPRMLADRMMSILRDRFDSAGLRLRNSVDWSDFARAIRHNSEVLSELLRLERAGLEPHLAGVMGNAYIINYYSASVKAKDSGHKVSLRVERYEE